MTAALPDVLGVRVIDGLGRAGGDVAHRPGAALDAAWPAIERGLFRLTGLAVSHWMAAGAPDAAKLPLPDDHGDANSMLTMGSLVWLLGFCGDRAPLLPPGKLSLPALQRLAATIAAVREAIAGQPINRIASPRFDLAAASAAAPGNLKGASLARAMEVLTELRNLESHHAGRKQEWVDDHPDYPRLFAPLLVAAAVELFTHPELVGPLRGWVVATAIDVEGARRGKPGLATLQPDTAALQRAYVTSPPAALAVDDRVVLDVAPGAARAAVVMPFTDLAHGVPEAMTIL